jgi:hypothetical protein
MLGLSLLAGLLPGNVVIGIDVPGWCGLPYTAAAVAALAAGWSSRDPLSARRPVLTGLFSGLLLALLSAWGLVMHLVVLMATGTVDSWPRLAVATAGAVGALITIAALLSFQRRSSGRCGRCGVRHDSPVTGDLTWPRPRRPSRRIRLLGYLGAAAFAPYILMKALWAGGWTLLGTPGPPLDNGDDLISRLARYGIDLTSVLALLAAVLSIALVSRWSQVYPRWLPLLGGRRVPRWFPLSFAWLGAATLAPYGLITIMLLPLWSAGIVHYDWGPDTGPLWVAAVGAVSFGGFGGSVAVTAVDYQRRGRPHCRVTTARLACRAADGPARDERTPADPGPASPQVVE